MTNEHINAFALILFGVWIGGMIALGIAAF